MTFKDYFSRQAKDYARFRPQYPPELLEFLSGLVDERGIAWDCATGNGQVATELVRYFEKVHASDGSQAQIENAPKHDRIEYLVSVAESTPLPSNSVDLITVAQALHWFDLDRFYTEVKRVLKPKGIIALWCYGFFELPSADEGLKATLQSFFAEIEPFWPPERELVNQGYRSISFPFAEIESPSFAMSLDWTAEQAIGYLCTWSAFQHYIDKNGETQIGRLLEQLEQQWGNRRSMFWPIALRVGRYPD